MSYGLKSKTLNISLFDDETYEVIIINYIQINKINNYKGLIII